MVYIIRGPNSILYNKELPGRRGCSTGACPQAGEPVELVIIYVEKRISAEKNRILRDVEGEGSRMNDNRISSNIVIMNYESWLLSVTTPL